MAPRYAHRPSIGNGSAQSHAPHTFGETTALPPSHPPVSTLSLVARDLPPPPSGAPAAPEAALVERARRDEPGAFRELFHLHAPRVWRFLRDLLGTAAAADEATQEAFVRAHAALTAGAPVERLAPWLFGIARNVAREHRRADQRTVPMADPVDDDAPSVAPDPESLLSGRQADDALARALDALADDRRAALLLRIDHDLAYDDIAAALAWPLARVKNEIHRARLQLRAALTQHLDPAEHRHGR